MYEVICRSGAIPMNTKFIVLPAWQWEKIWAWSLLDEARSGVTSGKGVSDFQNATWRSCQPKPNYGLGNPLDDCIIIFAKPRLYGVQGVAHIIRPTSSMYVKIKVGCGVSFNRDASRKIMSLTTKPFHERLDTVRKRTRMRVGARKIYIQLIIFTTALICHLRSWFFCILSRTESFSFVLVQMYRGNNMAFHRPTWKIQSEDTKRYSHGGQLARKKRCATTSSAHKSVNSYGQCSS